MKARDVVMRDGVVAGVVVEGRDGRERLESRLLVAADGRRSVVARRLGLLREHRSLRKFAVRGYWSGVQGLTDHGEMHVTRGGYCGIAPSGPTEANVTFVLDQADMRAAGGDLDAFYLRTLSRWPQVAERLEQADLEGPARAIGPLALEARRVSAPGAVLVGDAAGFYDPFTGEGVTLALRGAELAGEVAHRALSRDRRTSVDYDVVRDEATRDKFRLNRLLQRIVAWPALANGVAKRLARRPDLADQLVGVAGDFVPARTALGAGLRLGPAQELIGRHPSQAPRPPPPELLLPPPTTAAAAAATASLGEVGNARGPRVPARPGRGRPRRGSAGSAKRPPGPPVHVDDPLEGRRRGRVGQTASCRTGEGRGPVGGAANPSRTSARPSSFWSPKATA